jgi:hypothetical protein
MARAWPLALCALLAPEVDGAERTASLYQMHEKLTDHVGL